MFDATPPADDRTTEQVDDEAGTCRTGQDGTEVRPALFGSAPTLLEGSGVLPSRVSYAVYCVGAQGNHLSAGFWRALGPTTHFLQALRFGIGGVPA